MKNEYKGLSKEAKSLLNSEESYDVDWKVNIKGFHSEDIVAFANSRNGGSVLIGVEELKDGDGKQKSKIVGCPINDENKMNIKSKAFNCIPPIHLDIIVEKIVIQDLFIILKYLVEITSHIVHKMVFIKFVMMTYGSHNSKQTTINIHGVGK